MSSQPSDEPLQLSLCIATFNRASFIGATLQSILGQCNDAVEVVILDGGSSDDTAGVVRQYAQRYPCVRYFRQEVNRGVDPDFDRAVGEARGRYCWLMTDDDLLRPGAIDTVLDAIRQDYALIIVNAEVR